MSTTDRMPKVKEIEDLLENTHITDTMNKAAEEARPSNTRSTSRMRTPANRVTKPRWSAISRAISQQAAGRSRMRLTHVRPWAPKSRPPSGRIAALKREMESSDFPTLLEPMLSLDAALASTPTDAPYPFVPRVPMAIFEPCRGVVVRDSAKTSVLQDMSSTIWDPIASVRCDMRRGQYSKHHKECHVEEYQPGENWPYAWHYRAPAVDL
ncbi:uncharacterized protein CLAFUR5_13272 [Fulvia fulva]|uniref:Uncharacterized protein n=1 Tax=Passalora fulva TaxID=5499 RepID=A0A9Q8UVM6_PASFU|nr:uncharacterized protein CLAFUR5_13272 [Fulvia fulva]KAK4612542.1 hypothetical protein CLAFUR0_13429 [Fulvia fulva]UJO24027.1 hypothetical protein CLAFUR5_13272 [Fulvia fulva]